MPSKLRFFVEDKKKTYTLKESVDGKPTQDAHYKFLKIKDAPKTK
jgi:hypothetical protein